MSSIRKRPVITVVEARPMNEVGFRDAKAETSVSPGAPKAVPPMPKNPPIARPVPPVPVERKPTTSTNINGLDLDDPVKKLPNAAPPKPQRNKPARPITMQFDGQNNIITDEQKSVSGKPIPMARPSSHEDGLSCNKSNNMHISADTNDSWKQNYLILDESLTRSKPKAAPRRPTIIRASTYESKSSSYNVPPPVSPKNLEAKQHSADLNRVTDAEDMTGASDDSKAAAKQKPMVRPKSESKPGPEESEFKLDQRPDVRKRPTVIRPPSGKISSLSGDTVPQNTVPQNTDSIGNNPPVQLPIRAKVAPTVIRPGINSLASTESHSKVHQEQKETISNQSGVLTEPSEEAPCMANEQLKTRPDVVRPKVESTCKDRLVESSVSISSDGSAVHFSSTPDEVQPDEKKIRASVDVSEKQPVEYSKRAEMEKSQLKTPERPAVPPVHEPSKKLPSKPPPPCSSKLLAQRSSDIPSDISQPSPEIQLRRGPPPRPAVGPTRVKPVQPSNPDQLSADVEPALPGRPALGHPLFHYVVTEPHAIALFEYQSTHADELNFKASEVIILEKWVNCEWLYGRTAQASGMFPATYVDIIQSPPRDLTESLVVPTLVPPTEHVSEAPLPGSGPRCLARFDYDGEDPSDLTFVEGDMIRILERIGDEWIKGELNQREGMFPACFVEIIEDLPPLEDKSVPSPLCSDEPAILNDQKPDEINPSIEEKPHCIALYDFPAQNSDDLGFSAGDKIILLARINDDWLKGEIHDKTGIFPSSFVRIVQDLTCQGAVIPKTEMQQIDPSPLFDSSRMPVVNSLACDISHETSLKATRTGVAVYDFQGETPDDLAFHVGDVVEIVEIVNEDWMEGKINGKSDIFPSAFVKLSE